MNLDLLKKKLTDFLEKTPYELYDVEYIPNKKDPILRVYIDSVKGITMDDVVEATHLLDPYIDELDPIDHEYMLEVSSPGAEKELRSKEQIKVSVNKHIYLETYEQKLEGKLVAFDGEYLTLLNNKNKKIVVNYIDVNLIRLAIKF
ncbi:MAG: ribosome maturation factor RimP [Candidatus Izemoplasmatales bacterium]|jgi:ribosome maturation factor RimP|nr:ribosome maturation factor RimP [Candidatus Izemoplasmatales bacterium]